MTSGYISLPFEQVVDFFSRSKTPKPSEMFNSDRYFIIPDDHVRLWAFDVVNFGNNESKRIYERYGNKLSCDPRAFCAVGIFNLSMWPTDDYDNGEDITTWLIPLTFIINPNQEMEFCMAELHLEHLPTSDCPIHDCLDCRNEEDDEDDDDE